MNYFFQKMKPAYLFIIIFFASGEFLQAQKKQPERSPVNFRQYILPASIMCLAGMLDGTLESMKFHYDTGFKPRFEYVNDQVWNPEKSWKNKYKNGNPVEGEKFIGSTGVFVFTTDAYHAIRTTKNLLNTFTVVFYLDRAKNSENKKVNWKKTILDALFLTAMRNIGFYTTYGFVFKPTHK